MTAENKINIEPLGNLPKIGQTSPFSGQNSKRRNPKKKKEQHSQTTDELLEDNLADDGEFHVIDYKAQQKGCMAVILKKNCVTLAGSVKLDSCCSKPHNPQNAAATALQPVARIVDSSEQSVTIEFICPCGTKSYIQCITE